GGIEPEVDQVVHQHRRHEEKEPDPDVGAMDAEPCLRDDEAHDGLGEGIEPQRPGSIQVLKETHREAADHTWNGPAHPAEIDHERDQEIGPYPGDRDPMDKGCLEDEDDEEHERVPETPHRPSPAPAPSLGAGDGRAAVAGGAALSGSVDSRGSMRGPRPAPAGR